MRAFYNDNDDTKSGLSNKSKASYKKLALDTSFSRHRAPPPQQVFPIADPSQDGPALSTLQPTSTSSALRRALGRKASRRAPSLSKPTDRRRPSPLKLDQDSMRDGRLAVNGASGLLGEPPRSAVMHSATILASKTYDAQLSRTPVYELGIPTPRIIITPARESFTQSPEPSTASTAGRPASSVYSRYTQYIPDLLHNEQAPPLPNVPPFQLVATGKGHLVTHPHHSKATNFEEDHASICTKSDKSPSSSQALEELDQLTPLPSDVRGMTPGLPTPQRSEGWWNFLTSPFSARSGSFFSRSPSLNEYDDTNELRPDSRQDDRSAKVDSGRFLKPFRPLKRSCTAPGALDPHAPQEFSIYYIAHNGEAEAYFDASRNFPSVCGMPDASDFRELEVRPVGWSPSHSVLIPSRVAAGILSGAFVQTPEQFSPKEMFQAIPSEAAARASDGGSQKGSIRPELFTSPSEDEMKTTKIPTVSPPSRSYTQVTGADSLMSPMSATPVVQHAHMATLTAPDFSHGELREVDVASRRSSPRDIDTEQIAESKPAHLGHQRQESYGLGITSEKASSRAPSLPPPPRENTGSSSSSSSSSFSPSEAEKEDRRTSSFRALESGGASTSTRIPWYRRFFWPLAAALATLLVLLIVLLVLFVPPKQQTSSSSPNLAVQASWLNTTGFPAVPIGVTTVAQPQVAQVDGSCMPSASLWSCAAGSEQGLDGGDVTAAIPNFRFQIAFRNGTLPVNQTGLLARDFTSRILPRDEERRNLLKRNAGTDVLFTPVPSPHSIEDQRFMGQMVDGITAAPYEGEETPFFMTVLSPKVLSKREGASESSVMVKRDSAFPYPVDNANPTTTSTTTTSSTTNTNTNTSPPQSAPPPTLQQNGLVLPPTLYPLAAAQPLRLFNRGQQSEHYGFYTYFTRVLYIQNATANTLFPRISNDTNSTNGISTNSTAISSKAAIASTAASATATGGTGGTGAIVGTGGTNSYALFYTQTRMHVQIWTRRGSLYNLPSSSSLSTEATEATEAKDSSANIFTGTGSFPYPVTVSIDRPFAGNQNAGGKGEGSGEKGGVWAVEVDAVTERAVGEGRWVEENVAGMMTGKIGGRDGGNGGECVCQWTT